MQIGKLAKIAGIILVISLLAIPISGCVSPQGSEEEFNALQEDVSELNHKVSDLESLDNLLIMVNSGMDKPYNQYAAYVIAFLAKQLGEVDNVTVFYGPQGVEMAKTGTLADLAINDSVKELIAGQLEGVSASDLPDNLELLARFVKDKLGVTIASCGTFHVIDGFAETPEDTSNIEEFIVPVELPQAWAAIANADKILYY